MKSKKEAETYSTKASEELFLVLREDEYIGGDGEEIKEGAIKGVGRGVDGEVEYLQAGLGAQCDADIGIETK